LGFATELNVGALRLKCKLKGLDIGDDAPATVLSELSVGGRIASFLIT
jgi:hypothetical protein